MTNHPTTEGGDRQLTKALRRVALVYTALVALLLVLVFIPIRCSNPLPFGPGRVDVSLDGAAVRFMDHAVLFQQPADGKTPKPPRQVLELHISSRTDLLEYFGTGDRQLQVRCAVVGNTNGKRYSGFALDPIPEGADAGVTRAPGTAAPEALPHRYTIHAFLDLKADDVEYEGGKPATTLDLKTSRFDALRCHLAGVTMAPVLWPRSNDLIVTAEQFRALLRRGTVR